MRYSFGDAHYTDNGNLTRQFTIPKPLSINQLYATNRHTGAKYITAKGKHWFEVAGRAIKDQRFTDNPVNCPVSLSMIVYFSGRYDIDNCLKALLDLMKMPTDKSPHGMGIIEDDELIWEFKEPFKKVRVPHRKDEKLEFTLNTI